MVSNDIKFSLIVPTYNESENIVDFLNILNSLLRNYNIKYEIIVVDDNSPDKTWKIVEDYSRDNPQVKLLRRFLNKGLTPAVLDAIRRTEGELVGVMDADLQHDPTVLQNMIEFCNNHDLVIGSRYLRKDSISSFSFYRRWISKLGTILARVFLGIKLTDPLSGYFVVRKSVIDDIAGEISARGFKILLEILGRRKNLRIHEVEYTFSNRKKGTTKLSGEVAIDFIAALLSLRFGQRFSPRFLRYTTIGFVGIFVNLGGQWFGNYIFGVSEESFSHGNLSLPGLSITFGFFLSVLNNFILNNVWTFREKKITGIYATLFGFAKYLIITCIGLLIQISVWRLLVYYAMGYDIPIYGFGYIANFMGILTATAWNYLLSKYIMWKVE